MPTGRKPIPIALIDNSKCRLTKEEIEARRDGEVGGCEAKLKPPKNLSPEALTEWKRVVKLYRQLDTNILNDLDTVLLAAYCESVAIYQKAQTEYQKAGLLLQKDGKVVENPYLIIMRREGQDIAKYAEQLCLSPVGRARMGVLAAKKEQDEDPTAAFFAKYGYD